MDLELYMRLRETQSEVAYDYLAERDPHAAEALRIFDQANQILNCLRKSEVKEPCDFSDLWGLR